MQENNMMIPGISLCQKWGKIRIFHSTIVALGEPRYIRFLFNPDKKGLVVGTRPPLISETNLYEPHHKVRLAIKPGITGMWQVSGRSDITDFEEVVRLDREYIENWEFKISSVPMLRMIWNTCNWDKEKTYRLTGMCHIEHNLVEFDMKQATEQTADEF